MPQSLSISRTQEMTIWGIAKHLKYKDLSFTTNSVDGGGGGDVVR